jgi:hypothetical protein
MFQRFIQRSARFKLEETEDRGDKYTTSRVEGSRSLLYRGTTWLVRALALTISRVPWQSQQSGTGAFLSTPLALQV